MRDRGRSHVGQTLRSVGFNWVSSARDEACAPPTLTPNDQLSRMLEDIELLILESVIIGSFI